MVLGSQGSSDGSLEGFGGLQERFGVLREPCGARFGDHLGSKDGLRRFGFYGTLLASVEVVVWFENLLFGVLLFVRSSPTTTRRVSN